MPTRKSTQRKRQTRRLRRLATRRRGGSQIPSQRFINDETQYERERFAELMNDVNNAIGSQNKIRGLEILFAYILTTKYLLTDAGLRNSLLRKLNQIETDPTISPRLQNLLMATKEYAAKFD